MVDDTPLIAETRSNKKQGHRVFCCCDSRKAAILVSLVALVLMILALIGAALDTTPTDVWTWVSLSVSILFYLLVIWGAIRYHRCAVAISLIWEIVAIVLLCIGTAQYDWKSVTAEEKQNGAITVAVILAWRLIVVYANGTFLYEVGKGIMSHETHSRERYSCCCNV
ncbi:hypothetical protein ACHAXT_006187 [Thalassiosira profunda]